MHATMIAKPTPLRVNAAFSASYLHPHTVQTVRHAVSAHALRESDQNGINVSRRTLAASPLALGAAYLLSAQPAFAGFKKELKKRKLSPEDYTVSDVTGLKYHDFVTGDGPAIKEGDRIVVHWDAMYRGIDVASSRSARLLGGNRTIAEPFEFTVGEPVYGFQVPQGVDGGGGLFSGQNGPKPPLVLSTAAIGMKKGGKRTVIVDKPELGYGSKGFQEIPADATFELKIDVLEVFSKKT